MVRPPHRARAVVLAALALALCGAATAACLQVAGLGDYEEGDGGGVSADSSVLPSSDGGVLPVSDAAPRSDASTFHPCARDSDCLSGTVCETSACVELTHCATPDAGCAVFPQCGCPGVSTCLPFRGMGPNGCAPAGTVPLDGLCDPSTNQTCQVGLGCYDSRCLAFCDPRNEGTAQGCGMGETCTSVASPGSPPAAVCVSTCSPLVEACDGGNCDFLPDLLGVPVCVSGDGTALVGQSCGNEPGTTAGDHCASGLFCGPNSFCDVPVSGSDPGCAGGSTYDSVYGLSFGYCGDAGP